MAERMYVIVVGAGKVGWNLGRELLDKGHEVTLIDNDRIVELHVILFAQRLLGTRQQIQHARTIDGRFALIHAHQFSLPLMRGLVERRVAREPKTA